MQFDPLLAFDKAVETFKLSNLEIPGEIETVSPAELPPPVPVEEQIHQDVQNSIVELDRDLQQRLDEYEICKVRGHAPTPGENPMIPGHTLCRYCGTYFREKVVYEEVNTPEQQAEMLRQYKEAQVITV